MRQLSGSKSAERPNPKTPKSRASRQVLRHLRAGSEMMEIGLHLVDFAAEIVGTGRASKVRLIDPWKVFKDPKYKTSRYGRRVDAAEMEQRYEDVQRRFAGEIESGLVSIYRQTSEDAAPRFADNSLDFVCPDSDSSLEGAFSDIRNYWPEVKTGGLLCGDDYRRSSWWGGGVVEGFRELLASLDAMVQFKVGSQIGVTKIDLAGT